MRIQHNITAMNSYRNFNTNSSRLSKNLEKLSSGYKINRAGDDAAGLAISEKMRAQITGLEGATKNAKDGISLIQTAEGALTEVHDMLNRMTTLAEQSANGTYQNELDREQLQKEVQALKDEIDRVADSTNFNGLKLLDGSLSDKFESVTVKPSAISNIEVNDYAAQSVSSAFSASFIRDRPNPQSVATTEFEVSFDDIQITGGSTHTDPEVEGDSTVEATRPNSGGATVAKSGKYTAGSGETASKTTLTLKYKNTAENDEVTKTFEFDADATIDDIVDEVNTYFKDASGGNNYVEDNKKGFKAEATGDGELKITGYGDSGASDGNENSAIVTELTLTPGTTVDKDTTVRVNIGNAKLDLTFDNSAVVKGGDVATAVAQAGKKMTVAGDDTDTTTALNAAYKAGTDDPADGADNKYIEIDGHYYEMQATGNKVKFTQVDKMEEAGTAVTADYPVSVYKTGGDGTLTGTVNWFVQNTTDGNSGGSTHQAQAEVSVDFTKLKDGDKLTAGDQTYVFKIGSSSLTKADTSKGEKLVDLSDVMKESSDLTNSSKQALAMDEITRTMASSAAWSAGNGGVADDVGTLTFQSLSGYIDDKKDIGGYDKNGKVNMSSEANVMKQFFATSAETAASVTFDFDASQIKVGDTFQLDGKTFEFTDGDEGTKASNFAINLHDLGVNGGLTSAQNDAVMQLVKEAIEKQGNGVSLKNNEARYNVSINGNKMTLTSKEDTTTTNIYEKRTAAKLELPTEVKHGEGLVLQIGDTAESYNKLTVSIEDMHSKALGIGDLNISTQEGAAAALDKIKAAINSVSDTRGNMGALQNRLDHTINNLGVMRENIQSAESVIRDTDVAEEMMTYTKNNILNQSAQAMLAQANQLPQGVLQLLG